jgi:uncharacterized Ntn-hydrolase superfamily protein
MTFSIAGLCPRTLELGCALATSSMASGARVPFVVPGRGVILSQARSDPTLGMLGVRRLEAGCTAKETVADMVSATANAAWRQLAVVDQAGRVAEFTGPQCMAHKGAHVGKGAVAIGNALANDRVVAAILEGFEARPDRSLTDRLIMALECGLAAGGEPYPLRSAALKVGRPGIPFPVVDLRADLSEAPISALSKLWETFEPMAEGYLQRALDPANAPSAEQIEGQMNF